MGEIEACLLSKPAVRECAVVAPSAAAGSLELRAYVALTEGSGETRQSLREYLLARLPEYMVPAIVILDKMPKSNSDKIDRKALLAMQAAPEQPAADAPAVSFPEGTVQEYLNVVWEQALGRKVPHADADFFELGGHSLLAAKLIATIGKAFRVEYPFSAFFAKPTIAAAERTLERLVGGKTRLEKMAGLRLQLARMSPEEINTRLEILKRSST